MRTVVRDCLGVSAGEEVLVICNAATQGLGERLRAEAEDAGRRRRPGADGRAATRTRAEPPARSPPRWRAADVVLAPTVQSLSHTAARKAASEAGARIATLPGVTEEMLARVMSADMEGLRRKGHALADSLTRGTEARITCAQGSDLRLGLEGRKGIPDAGELTAPGAFGNLPCGEGFIAPVEGPARAAVVAGSIAGIGMVSEPVDADVSKAVNLIGTRGRGGALLELLTAHGEDGTNVAELGIGTNEKATLTGEVLEDEKILGTIHVAFGASAAIGGTVQVPVHLDCVVFEPELRSTASRWCAAGSSSSESLGCRCSRFPTSPRAATRADRRSRGRLRRGTSCSTATPTPTTTAPSSPSPRPAGRCAGALSAARELAVERDRHVPPCRPASAIGALDVCPVVWLGEADREAARAEAMEVAGAIAGLGVPVFLYGELASAPERRERAFFRRGGLAELGPRMRAGGSRPTWGPHVSAPERRRDTCHRPSAARRFNVELDTRRRRGRARGRRRRCASRAAGCRACGRSGSPSRRRAGLDQRPRPARGPAR